MKKSIFIVCFILCLFSSTWAADVKMTEMTADTSPSGTDIVWTTKDPGGSPLDRKVTLEAILGLKLGTLTNTKWCSSDGTVVNCTETAPAPLASPIFTTQIISPIVYGSSADNGDITIEGTSSGTKTTSYVILQPTAGNVGIGATSPGYLLTLLAAPDTAASQTFINISRSTGAINGVGDFIGFDGAWTIGSMYKGSWGMEVLANSVTAIRVENNGNVGIGVAPGSKLDVNGGVAIGTYAGSNAAPSNGMIISGNVGIGTAAPDGQLSQGLGNGQQISYKSLTELTTIAAAATTVTTIAIPANVIVKAVQVRVTVVIPTAATFTVIGNTSTTAFNTAAVSVAAGSTDKGNLNCPYGNVAAQTIRITPNATPADNSGRVRVTIWYEDSVPPTS